MNMAHIIVHTSPIKHLYPSFPSFKLHTYNNDCSVTLISSQYHARGNEKLLVTIEQLLHSSLLHAGILSLTSCMFPVSSNQQCHGISEQHWERRAAWGMIHTVICLFFVIEKFRTSHVCENYSDQIFYLYMLLNSLWG